MIHWAEDTWSHNLVQNACCSNASEMLRSTPLHFRMSLEYEVWFQKKHI